MRESGYYPMGAEFDASAPYNEVAIPEREFEVTCSQTLSKSTSIWTDNYTPEYDDENGHAYADTFDTNWREVYKDVAMTPLDIINACETLAKYLLEQGTTSIGPLHMKELIKECEGWNDDDYEVVEG